MRSTAIGTALLCTLGGSIRLGATHMTKQEWRAACRRALKDYPGAFRR